MKTNAEIEQAVDSLLTATNLKQFKDWDAYSVCAVMGFFTAAVVSAVDGIQKGTKNETA